MTTPDLIARTCPKCGATLEMRPNMYALRDGSMFPGSVCDPCNSLWPEGCEGYAAFIQRAKELAERGGRE